MRDQHQSKLNHRKKYLQVAFNSTLNEARSIIGRLPVSDRIIYEAGTPLIKRYGMEAVRKLVQWTSGGVSPLDFSAPQKTGSAKGLGQYLLESLVAGTSLATQDEESPVIRAHRAGGSSSYVVADMKTMDRGATEVEMVAQAGGSGIIALGSAPTETLNAFIASCHANGLDAMLDMMNVEYPVNILRKLKTPPDVVIVHRGVDEERDNREKQIPLHEIRRIKGNYDLLVSVAGGDTPREVQRAVFNDADIVVIWKSVYHQNEETLTLVEGFLKNIK